MQSYMHLGDLPAALYMAKNKDNDDLYTEIVERNQKAGERVPKRQSAWSKCRHCPIGRSAWSKARPAIGATFKGFATKANGLKEIAALAYTLRQLRVAEWTCSRDLDPIEITPDTCCEGGKLHRYIPELVPGEQVDIEGSTSFTNSKTKERWVDSGV